LMEERKITSVIVTDDAGRFQGVVHIHDLWTLQLFWGCGCALRGLRGAVGFAEILRPSWSDGLPSCVRAGRM